MNGRVVRPRTLVGLGIVGVMLYGYPGLMSFDSMYQLDEARRWQLSDWHPPIMAAMWKVTDAIIAGPLGMLAIQATLLAIGLYLVLSTVLAARRAAIAAIAISWFPPVLVVMGVVWKDSQMAAFLMLGIGLLASPSRRARIGALVALLVAGALRHNAPAATFAPLILLWGAREIGVVRRWLVPVVVWVALTIASGGITRLLASRHINLWADSVALADIAGTIRFAEPISDADLRDVLAGTPLRIDHDIQAACVAHYHPRNYMSIPEDDPIGQPSTDAQRAALARAWRTLVLDHPAAYLRHRWTVFRRMLYIRGNFPTLFFDFSNHDDPALAARIGHEAKPSLVQRGWFWLVRSIQSFWYSPFLYLVLALVLLAFARTRLELALIGSGVAYELGWFPFELNPDYRYSHWLIAATVTVLVLVVARRARQRGQVGARVAR